MNNRTILVTSIMLALAGCGSGSDVGTVSADLTRCDPYQQPDCEFVARPVPHQVCTCDLKPGYECDPVVEKSDSCVGNQPRKCVAGHYENDGAVCANGTSCTSSGCITPPVPAPGLATLQVWNGEPADLSRYGTQDQQIDPANTTLARAWGFDYRYTTQPADHVEYQVALFPPSPKLVRPVALFDSGRVGGAPPSKDTYFNFDFTKYETYQQYLMACSVARRQGRLPPPPPSSYLPSGDPIDVYVRVVAFDAYENAIAISNAIHVKYGTIHPPPPLHWIPQHPTLAQVKFVHVQPPDENYQYWFQFTKDVASWHAGDEEQFGPKSSSWIDDVVSFVGDVVSWVVDLWDWIAHTYNAIKNDIVDFVATHIPGCNDTCANAMKDVLSSALDVGLAACGLPPSLPDVGQLMQDGQDWIADQLADQAGLDPKLAEQLVGTAAQKLKDAAQNPGGGDSFLRPAPDKQYHAGVLWVTMTNPSTTDATQLGWLTVTDSHGLFQPAKVTYSSLAPGQTATVLVALTPVTAPTSFQDQFAACFSGLSGGVANSIQQMTQCLSLRHALWQSWHDQYTDGSDTFELTTTVAGSNGMGGQWVDHGPIDFVLASDATKPYGP